MSCKIYLIRHGQSLGNLNNVFLGHTDMDLSPLGYKQAEICCEFLATKGIDIIYSSDLLRAYNTSRPLCNALNKEAVKSENLREIYAGEWEGKTFDFIRENYKEAFDVWHNDIGNAEINSGESVKQLYERVSAEILKIAENNDGKTVAVFTHATVIRTLYCFCGNMPLSEMKNINWCPNASVSEVIYSNKKFTMPVYGNNEFLGNIKTALPSDI